MLTPDSSPRCGSSLVKQALGLSKYFPMSLGGYKNILSDASLNNVTDLKDPIFVNLIKCAFIRNIEFNEVISRAHSNEIKRVSV